MFKTEDGAVVGSINQAELEPEEEEADLSKLLKADLVERAEAAGVDTTGMNKADLVAALEEANDDTDDTGDEPPPEEG